MILYVPLEDMHLIDINHGIFAIVGKALSYPPPRTSSVIDGPSLKKEIFSVTANLDCQLPLSMRDCTILTVHAMDTI